MKLYVKSFEKTKLMEKRCTSIPEINSSLANGILTKKQLSKIALQSTSDRKSLIQNNDSVIWK